MTFRYYVYVSDTKVEMLLSQIDPSFRGKRTSEWSLNLKLFGAKKGRETPVGDNRFARLEEVVRYLEDHGDVGSVDEPGQFFRGLLPMKWGPMREQEGMEMEGFFFCGSTQRTILGLVGSAAHVVGAGSNQPSDRPSALLGYAIEPLAGALRSDDDDKGELDYYGRTVPPEEGVMNAVRYAATEFPGPEQNLEFLAKRLVRGRGSALDAKSANPDKYVLLGTPLYVAMVD